MVVPGNGQKIWSIKLSPERIRRWKLGGVLLSSLVLIIGVVASYSVWRTEELFQLRTVNQQQKQKIDDIRSLTESVQDRVSRVQDLDNKIRHMVGLEESDKSPDIPSSVIGDGETDDVQPTLDEVGSKQNNAYVPSRSGSDVVTTQKESDKSSLSNPELIDYETMKHTLQDLNNQLLEQEVGLGKLEKEVGARLDYLASVPSTAPVRGEMTSPFGYRRSPFGSKTEFHSGMDIAAGYGTVVRAAANGIITFVGWKQGLGQVVEIQHGYGFTSCYCHLSAATVKKGDRVERADPIGNVGNNGRSTGPHLHFMIYKNGKLQDPINYMVH